MSHRTRAINVFADAVHVALGLHALYGRVAAAAVLDDEGTIVDMRPFVGPSTCVVCSLEWAIAVADDWHCARRVLLVSATSEPVHDLREDDIRLYQCLRDALAELGMELIDWIQTDGDEVRSLAFTCDVAPRWGPAPTT